MGTQSTLQTMSADTQSPTRTAKTAILILAAGLGRRLGSFPPKQFRALAGIPVIVRAVRLFEFLQAPVFCTLPAEAVPAESALAETAETNLAEKNASLRSFLQSMFASFSVSAPVWVAGGATRQESVRLGLEDIALHCPRIERVLVHDAARPLAPRALIRKVAVSNAHCTVPCLQPADSLKYVSDTSTSDTPIAIPRAHLRQVQTPQGFHAQTLMAIHRNPKAHNAEDDAELCIRHGIRPEYIEGDSLNFKLTTRQDWAMAERVLSGEIRCTNGIDAHRFVSGDSVILGGVRIPCNAKLAGFSDADCVFHALADALFAAANDGDIGVHFPSSEPQWRNAESRIFVKKACESLARTGAFIQHIDITILAEKPEIAPWRQKICDSVADCCTLSASRVSLKASTTDKLGFTGREEGIIALCSVTVRLPFATEGATAK